MSSQPQAAEWEYVVEGDLAPHLIPRGRPAQPGLAAKIPRLPDGAHGGIAASLGPVRPDDLLVIPAGAWPLGGWRRRCLYSPRCVAAIGERAAGLWVQGLPLPEVRARVALDDIALVEHRTAGPWHTLTVTARGGTLTMRHDEGQRSPVDAWTRRLRLRAASPAAPLPPDLANALPAAPVHLQRRCPGQNAPAHERGHGGPRQAGLQANRGGRVDVAGKRAHWSQLSRRLNRQGGIGLRSARAWEMMVPWR